MNRTRADHRPHRWRLGALLVAAAAVAGSLPALAAAAKAEPGCQTDRRTAVHTAMAQSAAKGTWMPCLIDTGMTTLETGMAVDRAGTLFRSATSAPLGIAVSTDKGATWQRRALPAGAPTGINDGVVDPDTGRYFYVGAGDSMAYYTDDRGKTWKTGTFDSSERQDWSKVFVGRPVTPRKTGYPNNVYYCNWTIPLGVVFATRCYVSTDGGSTFRTAGPDLQPRVCDGPFFGSPGHGRGVVDPRTGWVYLPIGVCGTQHVFVSKDEMKTWTDHVIPTSAHGGHTAQPLIDTATNVPFVTQNATGQPNPVSAYMGANASHENVALDAKGRLYASWVTSGYAVNMATSPDGGRTWSAAKRISPATVEHAILPAIAVTPQGRVGLSYYGTTDGGATWTGYLSLSDNPLAATPTVQSSAVTRPGQPLMNAPCCWAQGAQEYTAVRWAPDGSLYGAFAGYRPEGGDAEGFLGRLVPRR